MIWALEFHSELIFTGFRQNLTFLFAMKIKFIKRQNMFIRSSIDDHYSMSKITDQDLTLKSTLLGLFE